MSPMWLKINIYVFMSYFATLENIRNKELYKIIKRLALIK